MCTVMRIIGTYSITYTWDGRPLGNLKEMRKKSGGWETEGLNVFPLEG